MKKIFAVAITICVFFLISKPAHAGFAPPTYYSKFGKTSEYFDLSLIEPSSAKVRIVVDDGAYLYKGPSTEYGKIEGDYKLPKGTIVTSVYSDSIWLYVEYDGKQGWVQDCLDAGGNYTFGERSATFSGTGSVTEYFEYNLARVSLESQNEYIYPTKEITLQSSIFDDTVIDRFSVEFGQELPIKYYFANGFKKMAYVSYEGHEGWYEYNEYFGDVANSTRKSALFYSEATLKASLNGDDYKTVSAYSEATIKFETSLGGKIFFYVDIETNDDSVIRGWTSEDSVIIGESIHLSGEKEIPLYDQIGGNVVKKEKAQNINGEAYRFVVNEYNRMQSYYYYINLWDDETEGRFIKSSDIIGQEISENVEGDKPQESPAKENTPDLEINVWQIIVIIETIIVLIAFILVKTKKQKQFDVEKPKKTIQKEKNPTKTK